MFVSSLVQIRSDYQYSYPKGPNIYFHISDTEDCKGFKPLIILPNVNIR